MAIKVKKEQSELGSKTIDQVLEAINKQHGSNTVYKVAACSVEKVDVISTGSVRLDAALGTGGLPRGRVVEIYGEPSTGKSTAALSAIAEAQRQGLKCFFIDVEHALDMALCQGIGVNIDELYFCQPDCAEQALDVAHTLVSSGLFAIGVIDSVAALVPRAELEGNIGDQTIGLQARLLGQTLRMLTGVISRSNTCLIFINQTRSKIGGFGHGPQKDTPGGAALKFYSSVRLEVKRIGSVKQGEDVIGNELQIVVVKNKLAPPFRKAETELIFGHGFNKAGELLDMAKEKDIIEQNGAWFSYGDERIGQGRPAVCKYLEEHPAVMDEIRLKIEGL